MRESLYGEMKRYVRFDEADAAELRAFGEVAEPHFRKIAQEFYDRIREHEDAHQVFTGEEQIERLKKSLVRWMERLCAGPHDENYYEERAKIGRIHVKIGLPQRYMFTAMALIRASFEEIASAMGERAARTRITLARALDLELGIMLETYHEDLVARIRRIASDDRDRLERDLARVTHRYARAVELARVLVVGLDAGGLITLFNPEAERVSGYALDEALGRPFVELLLPERNAEADAARIELAAAGKRRVDPFWESPLRTRAGKERTIRWQLAYAPSTTDDEVVVFAIGQDVTDERVLLERTLQSEKLAAVGTLAAGLAHEIRNPLNGALLHVTFLERALERAGGDAEALETARFIGSEIRRLSTLVKEFLVFARPSPTDLRPTSLRAICQRTLDVLADEAAAVRAELATDYANADLHARVDAGKMEQVVLNLVKNAIDAVATTGGGRVVVRTRRSPHHGFIEVEDEGPGLPAPDAPIFDAFYSTKPHGTGLGLAIVHRVVTDHGGTIEVDSRPGRTSFKVSLPLYQEDPS
jgi:PAS domain S-box-containing protein